MRNFERVYEEFTDSSAFEHVNPNLVKRAFVDYEHDKLVYVTLEYVDDKEASYPFEDHKAAHRFIKRVSGVK